jgi:hypothetical protein
MCGFRQLDATAKAGGEVLRNRGWRATVDESAQRSFTVALRCGSLREAGEGLWWSERCRDQSPWQRSPDRFGHQVLHRCLAMLVIGSAIYLGGNYRLVAAFDFRRQIAFVKFIGTHAEYDRIDASTVSQF